MKKKLKKKYIKPILKTENILETVTLNCGLQSGRTCANANQGLQNS